MEEEKTLEEKAEVAEQVAEPVSEEEAEPTPEIPGAEVSSEAPEAETKTLQEQLADQVKACVIESRNCEGLGGKLEDTAQELGIGLDELIDQVFEIISRKEG